MLERNHGTFLKLFGFHFGIFLGVDVAGGSLQVYLDGTTTMSVQERKASLGEFYGMVFPLWSVCVVVARPRNLAFLEVHFCNLPLHLVVRCKKDFWEICEPPADMSFMLTLNSHAVARPHLSIFTTTSGWYVGCGRPEAKSQSPWAI